MNVVPFGIAITGAAGAGTPQLPPSGFGFAVALDGALAASLPASMGTAGESAAQPLPIDAQPIDVLPVDAGSLPPPFSAAGAATLAPIPEARGVLPQPVSMAQLLTTAARITSPGADANAAPAPALPQSPAAAGPTTAAPAPAPTDSILKPAATPVGEVTAPAAEPSQTFAAAGTAQPSRSRKTADAPVPTTADNAGADAPLPVAEASPATVVPVTSAIVAPPSQPLLAAATKPLAAPTAEAGAAPAARKNATRPTGAMAATAPAAGDPTPSAASSFGDAFAKLAAEGQAGSGAGDTGHQPQQQAASPIDRAATTPAATPAFHAASTGEAARPAPTTPPAAPAPAVAHEAEIAARPGHLGHSLGVEIASKIQSGEETLRVRLNPAELGRIEVTLAFDDRGSLQATMRTDSVQALDLLRQDVPDLARTLDQAGVRTDAQSFRFESRAGDGGGQNAPHQQQRGNQQHAAAEQGDFETDDQPYRAIRSDGRVDLLA